MLFRSLPGDPRWEYDDLARLREYVESYGLRLEALENTPKHFYEGAMLGTADRDRQIEHYQATIRNVGRAGIPILGYHWMPNSVWRSQGTPLQIGRGGARVTAFDMKLHEDSPNTHGRVYTADEMWENYVHFIKAVIPAAEDAGIKLALHPDDPPLPAIRGQPRLVYQPSLYQKVIDLNPSPANALEFCVGSLAEMTEGDIYETVDNYSRQQRLGYVHLRNVRGKVPHYRETFIDDGDVDVLRVLAILHRNHFRGVIIPDHTPQMSCAAPWHAGMAYALGYLQAGLQSLKVP